MQSSPLSNVNDLSTSIRVIGETQTNDIWDEFLRLQISHATKRTYAAAIDNFFTLITGSPSNPEKVAEFLGLNQHQAIAIFINRSN